MFFQRGKGSPWHTPPLPPVNRITDACEKLPCRNFVRAVIIVNGISVKFGGWQMAVSFSTAFVIDNYRPQRSWGKVMFLQASVILLTGGVPPPLPRNQTPPPEQTPLGNTYPPNYVPPRDYVYPPPPRGRSMCGRYASYWNAFLFLLHFADNWSAKAKRRRTQGVGRMRHLRNVFRRFRCV